MGYWACAQLEPNRTALALHCLGINGFEVYCPRLREQLRRRGRKIVRTPPLFPNYAFLWIVRGWWDARWSPGVVRLIMAGLQPARVADGILVEIRSREIGGLIEMPRSSAFRSGQRVRILQGPFAGHLAIFNDTKPHERCEILLQLLGSQSRTILPLVDIERVR